MHKQNQGLFGKVYNFVGNIPMGKVVTYGQVASKLGLKDVRKVGWALHANKSEDVPCHRVVNKDGKLAANFAFDGPQEQFRRLSREGVKFVDDMHVDLEKSLWVEE